MSYKLLFAGGSFLLIVGLNSSCNSGAGNNSTTSKQDSTKSSIPAPPEIVKLLTHFKDNSTFPVIVDSAYISKIDKHDSLGANEVKLLTKKWFHDSLLTDSTTAINDFYIIDSVKAKHGYGKWLEKQTEGDIVTPLQSNAYGLQRIKLNDGTTILEWALEYSQQMADPIYSTNNIYFTILYNGVVGQTFLLGSYDTFADPPGDGYEIISGNLTMDGKLAMERKTYSEDLDSMKGELSHSHYEYVISNGTIAQKNKKHSPDREIKIKDPN